MTPDLTARDLWITEIAKVARCEWDEAATAVDRFGAYWVMMFVKANGRLPSDGADIDTMRGLVDLVTSIVEGVRSGTSAFLAIHDYVCRVAPNGRYERIQQRIAQRGGRRRKHDGRLAKLVRG